MQIKYQSLLFVALTLLACSKNDGELPEETPPSPEISVYTTFTDEGVMDIPGSDPAAFKACAVRIKGDTLFVANDHDNDRSIYIVNLSTVKLIGKINEWTRKETAENFNDHIGDIAVTDQYIYVGMYNSRINVFDRKTLKFINVMGRTNGQWGDDIYSMTHCYGLRESDNRLMVRDKNTIRGYWIYETVTEPESRVPWIGKVQVSVGYDYDAKIHSMAEYKGRMYLTDWYQKSIQVFTPSKMEIVFGEATHIKADTVYNLDVQPLGLLAYGDDLLMSTQKSGNILRYQPETGKLLDTMAVFDDRQIGRMEIAGDYLYYVDLKTNKLMKAKGELK